MLDEDLKHLKLMIRMCKEVADATGVEKVGTFTTLDSLGAAHVGGTARMGTSAKNSVVNSFGQCHDVRNLFVADGSVLVTEGCGDSPSLTIIALALRTADSIISKLKKGEV
jgi:choline dehydrogenase-like flavoprotein